MDDLPRTPDGLSRPQLDVLRAIVRAPIAWVEESALDGVVVARLTAPPTVYLRRWAPTGTPEVLVTLSAWGARQLGVALGERGPDEHPVWVEAPPEDPRRWPTVPYRLPAHPRECPLPHPELVADPRGGPELLVDPVSEEPVVLLGELVRIDPRMRRPGEFAKRRGGRPARGSRGPRRIREKAKR